MKKGIIMEINESFLTLLTPKGEFLRAKKLDISYSIGEEIYFIPISDKGRIKWFPSLKNPKLLVLPVAAFLIFISTVIPTYQSNQAYAYMSIDAELSIELGLNKKMQVVEINSFNEDTEKIVAGLENWKKTDVTELTKILLAQLREEGMIDAKEPVIISTIKTKQIDEKIKTKLEQNIEEIKHSIVDHKIKVNEYTTSKEEIEKARSTGVSIAKYHRQKNVAEQQKHQLKEKPKGNKIDKQNNNVPSVPSNPEVSNQNANIGNGQTDLPKNNWKQREENRNVPTVQQEEQENKSSEHWKERQNQTQDQRLNQHDKEYRESIGQNKKVEQQIRGNENRNHKQQWQSHDQNQHNKRN